MFYEIRRHLSAYLVLGLILIGHMVAYYLLWPNVMYQRITAVSLAVFYFFWGVSTHLKSQFITKQIVREYFFAALLAGGILYLLTV